MDLAGTITIELDVEHEVFVEAAPVDGSHCITEAGGVGADYSVEHWCHLTKGSCGARQTCVLILTPLPVSHVTLGHALSPTFSKDTVTK